MLNSRRILSLVPAKGVSERFKKKNIHPCNGVPLVVHPLRIIKECGFFDSTLISTESEEVIKTCEEYGFSENYRRPEYMSLARSSVWDAVRHAMRYMSKQGLTFDYVAIMHPTSPCIRPQTVKTLCEHFHEHADVCDAMVAVAFWPSPRHSHGVLQLYRTSPEHRELKHIPYTSS
jgi:CMP-N-acetylneuraminic acid synthetase